MKTKIKYQKYVNAPNMDTVKEIILYGVETGGDNRQYAFTDMNGNYCEKSFNEVFYDATGLGQHLYTLGMREKKVAILSENSYYWIAAFYGICTGRMIAVPLDAKLNDDDLVELMVRSGCSAIFYSSDFDSAIQKMRDNPDVQITEYLKLEDFDELVKMGHDELNAGAQNYLDDEVDGDYVSFIVYTSGTTGKSKGVMLTQKNVAADTMAISRAMTASQTVAFLPFNHTLSWTSAIFASPLLAEWGYICGSLRNLQKDMFTYHPQHITAVPLAVETIYKRIWFTAKKEGKEKKLKKGLKISKFLMKFGIDIRRKLFKEIIDNLGGQLEMIVCGGAALDPKYENGLYDLGIQVINGYGTTECSPIITCNRLSDFQFGSAGFVLDCNEIKIHEPNEEGVGEVYVKGDNVMVGYYDDPEATKDAFDGEWFKTGDYGYMNDKGFLFLKGRKKNLIILSNGKNVSPEEIENKLMEIDYVQEVVVYEEDGAITAEFFLDTATTPDAKDKIKADVRNINMQLPTYKQVTRTKIRDTEFPKTTTLKIKRKYKS